MYSCTQCVVYRIFFIRNPELLFFSTPPMPGIYQRLAFTFSISVWNRKRKSIPVSTQSEAKIKTQSVIPSAHYSRCYYCSCLMMDFPQFPLPSNAYVQGILHNAQTAQAPAHLLETVLLFIQNTLRMRFY